MIRRMKSKDNSSFTGAPNPSYMSNDQVADYLAELRSHRVARPQGSRPLPSVGVPSRHATVTQTGPERPVSASIPSSSSRRRSDIFDSVATNAMAGAIPTGTVSHRRSQSTVEGANGMNTTKGRPLARAPVSDPSFDSANAAYGAPKRTYIESGQRWMEREEARSLRAALQDMDLQDEARLHAAAQDEASQLVWRHQHPDAPSQYARPVHKYKDHLKKDSYAKAMGMVGEVGGRVHEAGRSKMLHDGHVPVGSSQRWSSGKADQTLPSAVAKVHDLWDSPQKKAYMSLGHSNPKPRARRSSGAKARNVSGNSVSSLFNNPEDQIYEEPEAICEGLPTEMAPPKEALRAKPSNSAPRAVNRVQTVPLATKDKAELLSGSSVQSNQVRSSSYVTNKSTDAAFSQPADTCTDAPEVPMKDGLEIRSKEIREATSMRLKDRSRKLPTPAFVSDSPDRPIVSFDPDWQPPDPNDKPGSSGSASVHDLDPAARPRSQESRGSLRMDHHERAVMAPAITVTEGPAPSIPTINIPDGAAMSSIPTIHVPDDTATSTPTNGSSPASNGSRRPLPQPTKSSSRPLPRNPIPSRTSTLSSNYGTQRSTAACSQCGLAIAGRSVSALGARFHPECFACFHCGEALECVAFYPEPDAKRAERLHEPDSDATMDQSLRFYCHLDFHELFSPRCRSCKTPIEGEIVVACGGEWHVGHFFCAQCGDPFGPSTPFVEKDGYAWCVGCHTNRFSTKCKKCRRPVTDTVLKALGAEWHPDCFCCTECDGLFEDGRYFLRGDSDAPVCVRCEEQRLKN